MSDNVLLQLLLMMMVLRVLMVPIVLMVEVVHFTPMHKIILSFPPSHSSSD